MMSDRKNVRDSFSNIRLAVLYHPTLIEQKPLEEIRPDFERFYAEAAPVDLALVDIETNTPDTRVQEVVKTAYELEEQMKKERIK